MAPPELGHNRETSQRNDFFMMSVGGRDNPIPQMDMRTIEDLMRHAAVGRVAAVPAPPPMRPIEEVSLLDLDSDSDSDEDSEMSDADTVDLDDEQRRIVIRNATTILIRNMQAHLRFQRVDVSRIETETGRTALIVEMETRIQDMERMIEAFEDSGIINLQARRLFH